MFGIFNINNLLYTFCVKVKKIKFKNQNLQFFTLNLNVST